MTERAGVNGGGGITKISTSGALTVILSSPASTSINSSVNPALLIQGSDGNLYGATSAGNLPSTTSSTTGGVTTRTFVIPLSLGWNQIGDPFSAAFNIANINVSIEGSGPETFAQASGATHLISPILYDYNFGLTTPQYSTVAAPGAIAPYTGYWIEAFSAVNLILTTTSQ